MSFAIDTPIATAPTHYKPIEVLIQGDRIYVADDAGLSSWDVKLVVYSAGSSSVVVTMTFGPAGSEGELSVSPQQLFLMPDKTLERADKLTAGKDQLVLKDGTTVPLLTMTTGDYEQRVYDISTTMQPAHHMDGHLIVANNVVCGDYALQLADTMTRPSN